MSIKIGFFIERKAYYKHLGPVIDEALQRGHKVFCFHDYAQRRQQGKKAYQFASIDDLPDFYFGKPSVITFDSREKLIKKAKENNVQVLVSLLHMSQEYIDLKQKLKQAEIFLVSLQSGCDSLSTAESWGVPDTTLIYSQVWLDLAVEYSLRRKKITKPELDNFQQQLKEKIRIVGFPELEQGKMLKSNDIKREWGIPEDKKVVLYLPFPLNSSHNSLWVSYIYGKNNIFLQLPLALLSFNARYIKQVIKKRNDQNVVKSVRKFCDKNNAYLLVKSRKKDPVKPYVKKVADKVLYDEDLYPATMIKCLKIADLCCNFYSTAVIETSFMGVPNICIAPDTADWINIQRPLWQMLFEKASDLHDFPGVSYKLSIPEAINAFSEKTLFDFPFNKEKQAEYMKKYIGPLEGKYASNVVDIVENLVNTAKIR
ncbi:MAG: hypothetical protein HQ539_03230 [Parcubacteria group bacterium]|nr:hypothetical protein [Parcubacteria group bacterium]